MRVLITGATGFIGSHLVKGLLADGHSIFILKRSGSDCSRLADVWKDLTAVDLDRGRWQSLFERGGGVEAIIHAATSYGRHGESLAELVQANVAFPLQLLELAQRQGTALFINTDTFSSAPAVLSAHFRGYNLTKRQFLEWGKEIAATRASLCFRNMRLEHVYGPFDGEKKFVPSVIKSCLDHVPELKLTAGEQRRDFIYVEDVVAAYRTVLAQGLNQGCSFAEYQVGTGVATSIQEFVRLVHRLTDSRTNLSFGALPYADHEIMLSKADNAGLRELGWSWKVGLPDGIGKIVESMTDR
ncbi:NAD-dependent epimerase/dehydratase family protein [Brevibacillus brevis]|uniref:NAD-dependent epimerase/dehydratase family protein n=1 Tax=Brevibacillus brevis TaxID=1393 RepID=A0ABY9TAZ6_BREBE|nr:NAD-dependent epimerase/dehydratase family protein [Brevibacillus brevis]WNC16634.1 NAD-dependent epimerase/dehydratase family protein [Brevibacillus brevis]